MAYSDPSKLRGGSCASPSVGFTGQERLIVAGKNLLGVPDRALLVRLLEEVEGLLLFAILG